MEASPRKAPGGRRCWRCTVCGYMTLAEEPPDICPVCGATKDYFEPCEARSAGRETRRKIMSEREELEGLLRKKEEELNELRDARPQASCSRKDYSRPEDMTRALRIEELEDEIAEMKKRVAVG